MRLSPEQKTFFVNNNVDSSQEENPSEAAGALMVRIVALIRYNMCQTMKNTLKYAVDVYIDFKLAFDSSTRGTGEYMQSSYCRLEEK